MHIHGTYSGPSDPSAACNMLVYQYPVHDTVGAAHSQIVYSYSPGLEICIIHGIRRFITRSTNLDLCSCSEPIVLSH